MSNDFYLTRNLLSESHDIKDLEVLFECKLSFVSLIESIIGKAKQLIYITHIQSVQRQFTKRLKGYKLLTYTERQAKAGLCSLELRQLRADLILC